MILSLLERFKPSLPLFTLLILASGVAVPVMAASPRLQVFFASDFTDQAYQKKTYDKVAGSWKMPVETPAPGKKCVVIITIYKDGKASKPLLHMQSGSELWDQAALEALVAASPFDALPKSYKGDVVEVHWHFEWAN